MTDAERLTALETSLTNWTPSEEAVATIEHLRGHAKTLGRDIIEDVAEGRERALALTHLEETVMWAVKAVVLADRAETLIREGLQRQMDAQ